MSKNIKESLKEAGAKTLAEFTRLGLGFLPTPRGVDLPLPKREKSGRQAESLKRRFFGYTVKK